MSERSVTIRPMTLADVSAANDASYRALYDMSVAHHDDFLEPPANRTPEAIARSEFRTSYLVSQDPGGAWVAMAGDTHVGIALASRREDQWFLSLLSVATAYQSQGIGKRLLEAALGYSAGCSSAWLLSSEDLKATRRYHAAGFALHPSYRAKGPLDRALLGSVRDVLGLEAVRAGDAAGDRELVDDVSRSRRGSAYGPDLDAYLARGDLFVVSTAVGRGFVIAGKGGPVVLGATTPEAAIALLWTALAATTDDRVEISFISGEQPWAIDVAMAARLGLSFGGSLCVRGAMGPLTPYLPSGAYG